MKRIIFALLFISLLVLGVSFIPSNGSAQYPPPPTPVPQLDQTPGLSINFTNCDSTSIEWMYRNPGYDVDYFLVHMTTYDNQYWFNAPFFWGNSDVEYWFAEYDPELLIDREWAVQGIGYVPGFPNPAYFTDIVTLDCYDILIKKRVRLPVIFKQRW